MLSSCYKIIFGLLTKPATNHLITIHVVSIDQKGTTWNKACQWCNCTYGWAGNGSKDTFGRSHRYGPETQSLQICSAELSFHGQKNTAVTAGLGPSDVPQVPAGETPSRRQGKHLWRALGGEGDPPCSSEMTLEQGQGTAALPWCEKRNRGFRKGETAASKTSKDNTCCKTLMVKTIKVPRLFQTAPALGFLIIKIMSLNQKRSLKPSFCILLQLQSWRGKSVEEVCFICSVSTSLEGSSLKIITD